MISILWHLFTAERRRQEVRSAERVVEEANGYVSNELNIDQLHSTVL